MSVEAMAKKNSLTTVRISSIKASSKTNQFTRHTSSELRED